MDYGNLKRVRYAPEKQADRSDLKGAVIGIIDSSFGTNIVASGQIEGGISKSEWAICPENQPLIMFVDTNGGLVLTIMDLKRYFEPINPRAQAAAIASTPLDQRSSVG